MNAQDFFFKEKPAEIVLTVQKNPGISTPEVRKAVDSTTSHTNKKISDLRSLNLLKSKKRGRIKYHELTEKGEEFAETLRKTYSFFQDRNDDRKKTGNPSNWKEAINK